MSRTNLATFSLRLLAACSLFALSAQTDGGLISVPNRQDHVFDPVSKILYISTSSGTIERYDTSTGSFLSPWTIGHPLRGIDVTPDGQTVLVADQTIDLVSHTGFIHRVNAATNQVTTLSFPLLQVSTVTEGGSWDIVAMNNGKAFFTTDFGGSGTVPFHQLNLASNDIVTRAPSIFFWAFDRVTERTWLSRSADHSEMLMLESNSSAGRGYTYDAATDSFPFTTEFLVSHSDGAGAVSRDGQWFAVEKENTGTVWITSSNFTPISTLSSIAGGFIFDSDRNRLYGVDSTHDEIVVFSTDTWTPTRHYTAGMDLLTSTRFNGGVVSYNPFREELYVSVNGGILAIQVPEPSTFALAAIAGGMLLAMRQRLNNTVAQPA